MTYITHRQFAVSWAFIAAIVVFLRGFTEINYYLALILILPVAKIGAEFPDYDHHWQNIKNKSVPVFFINKLIHLTGGKHRSWQTHSIDIVAVYSFVAYILPIKLFEASMISHINKEILSIIMLGFAAGWWSHMIADMLTSGKVKLISWLPTKVSIVPKHIFKLRFNTGNEWEAFVYKLTKLLNIPFGAFTLGFPFIYKYIENGQIQEWVKGLLV